MYRAVFSIASAIGSPQAELALHTASETRNPSRVHLGAKSRAPLPETLNCCWHMSGFRGELRVWRRDTAVMRHAYPSAPQTGHRHSGWWSPAAKPQDRSYSASCGSHRAHRIAGIRTRVRAVHLGRRTVDTHIAACESNRVCARAHRGSSSQSCEQHIPRFRLLRTPLPGRVSLCTPLSAQFPCGFAPMPARIFDRAS